MQATVSQKESNNEIGICLNVTNIFLKYYKCEKVAIPNTTVTAKELWDMYVCGTKAGGEQLIELEGQLAT